MSGRPIVGAWIVNHQDVMLDVKSIRGPVCKTGLINKAWKQRYFVLNMEDKVCKSETDP